MKKQLTFQVKEGEGKTVLSYEITGGEGLLLTGDRTSLQEVAERLLSALSEGKTEVSLSFEVESEAEMAYQKEKAKEAERFLSKMKSITPGTAATMVLSADGEMYSLNVRRHADGERYQVALESKHKKYFLTKKSGKYMYEPSIEAGSREWLSYDDVAVAVEYFVTNRGERVPRES